MKRGEISVFLSLVFVLLISFVTGILEAAVVQTVKNISRLEADRAMFSVFGEYQRTLLKEYHVFALESGYGTGDYSEENILKRMHYYGTEGMEYSVSSMQYLTDNGGQAFREQVTAYMELRYGVGLVRDLMGMTEQWEEQSIQADNMEETEESILDDYRELAGGEASENLPEEQNPFSTIETIENEGILSLVLPDEMDLSGKRINLEDQVSYRRLTTGYGTFPARDNLNGIEEKLLFNEYILKQFKNAALSTQSEQPSEDTERGEERGSTTLDYEVEYILSGKSSDKENLQSVLLKIYLIRMSLNYIYLQGDSSRKAQAGALAVVIAALLLTPEIAEPLKQLILLVWAAGESVIDLRTLLSGRRVPLVKRSENWQLPLHSLILLGTGTGTYEGDDSQDGISYEDYLRSFLFLENTSSAAMRTLDRTEENLSSVYGLNFIKMDKCVSKLEINTKVSIMGDISYSFPVYFGYE